MFNEQLKKARKDKNYTQKQMTIFLNVSHNCYASWEQGRTEPNIEMIKKLSIILDITSDELLGIETNQEKELIKMQIKSTINPSNNSNNN